MTERQNAESRDQARARARERLAARQAQGGQPRRRSTSPAARAARAQAAPGPRSARPMRDASQGRSRASRNDDVAGNAGGAGGALQVAGSVLMVVLGFLKALGGVLLQVLKLVWGLFRKLPTKVQLAIAAVLVLLLVVLGVRGCMAGGGEEPKAVDASQEQTQDAQGTEGEDQAPKSDLDMIDQTLLSDYIGDDDLTSLMDQAQSNPDVAWIAAHIRDYDDFGYEIQSKLLKLTAREPAAVGFVRHYVEKAGSTDVQPCDPVESGTVPLLQQWDERWCYPDYSRSVIGLAGCGPTSMCMVYQGLTGQSDKSPYDLAVDAIVNDFVHGGTDFGFYEWEAGNLGLTYEELGVSSDELRNALKNGKVVICNVGPGDFTEVGHFIVLCGVDDQGQLTVNDPYSKVRSEKKWDIDQVVGQTQALLAFGA